MQSTNLGADRQEPIAAEFEFFGTLQAPATPAPPDPPEPSALSSAAPASEASGAYVTCGPLHPEAAR
ncbi:MAG: hypothetical protein ABJB12_19750, partial [Pseudomonadota bacterium]